MRPLTDRLKDLRSRINHNLVGGGIGAGVAFVLGFALLDYKIQGTAIGSRLIDWSYEIPFTIRGQMTPPEALMVFQDERSTQQLGESGDGVWDRARHAELVSYLKQDGAKVVVFDIVFSGPSASPESDEKFAAAIREHGKVVLGAMIDDSEISWGVGAQKLILPYALFRDAGAWPALVTMVRTPDRTIRKHFHGFSPGALAVDLTSLSWTAAELAGAEVTRDPEARFEERWVNYYGPPTRAIAFKSYFEVLQGTCPPGFFRDRIVFVGARQSIGGLATGLDEFPSPYALKSNLRGVAHPGVEIHATVFLNLVRQDWLKRFTPEAELAVFTLVGILFGFGLVLVRPLPATLWMLAGLAGTAVVTAQLFKHQLWFAWLIVYCQVSAAWFWSVVFNSVRLFVQKRLMEQSLGMYVSPSRVKQIAKRPDILKPGAEKQVVSVLFSDIANFTTISEGMDSDVLAKLMNNYFEAAVTHCIQKADGCVVKFIGDAIFAIWNAPEPQPDHQVRACTGALLLRDKVTEFMKELPENLKLVTRIGLHTGVANVGNFGSSRRIDYTAIGENINLASRMEGLNKYVGTIVLITRDTKDGIGDSFVTRLVGHFQLKGFEKVVEVYELLGHREEAETTRPWREAFGQALEQFQKRKFDSAEAGFHRSIELHPDDGPSKFYLKHITELRLEPPPDDWTGEIELKEK